MGILILGAGGHAQVIADILLAASDQNNTSPPIGYLDDNPALLGQQRLGLPILGSIGDLCRIKHAAVIIGIGNNRTRHILFEQLQSCGEQFATAIHPSAIIARGVEILSGSVICAGVIVNPGSEIGRNVILNTRSSIDHHNRIGDHAHIAPGACLGGDVAIGQGSLIGIGATVMPQRKVGAWSTVGAGALVHQNVPDEVTVIGLPARVARNESTSILASIT
jgi:sugar O-acyltransferase (sialic acid O-acetyltransferase NeuD family)